MTPHARLTAALAEHYPNARELRCSCGWQLPAHLSTFGNNFTAHLASVITSLEGVAVVETVQPSGVNGQDNAEALASKSMSATAKLSRGDSTRCASTSGAAHD